MSADSKAVVLEYFTRVRNQDPTLADLFHPEAFILMRERRVEGREAIRQFYQEAFGNARPNPTPVLTVAEGSHVAVEVQAEIGDLRLQVLDLFEIDGGLIRSLKVFT